MIAMSGDMVTGSAVGVCPRSRNVSIDGGVLASLRVAGEGDGINGLAGWRPVIYVDGVAWIEGEESAEVGPLGEGAHDIDVLWWSDEDVTPRFNVDLQGTRVLLRWSRVEDGDIVGYRLYNDLQTDAVNYSSLVASVSVVESARVFRALPGSGSGTGRISITGTWRGDEESGGMNALWRVRIAGAGLYEIDPGTGSYGDDLEFGAGLTVNLPGGLKCTFLDAAADYETGDTWSWWVGPRRWYISEELAAGTWKWGVRAVDAAGNESSSGAETYVVVSGEPDAPSGVTAGYDADSGEVSFAWTDGAGASSVRLYGNWNRMFGDVEDYVIEDEALAEIAAEVEEYVLETGTTGEIGLLKFYLRSVDAAGREEENATLIEVEAYGSPEASLGEPFGLTGVAAAGGAALLTWQVDIRDGVATSFKIYQLTGAPEDEGDLTSLEAASPVTEAAALSLSGFVGVQSYTTAVYSGTRYFVVRAVGEDDEETRNLVSVAVTADGTAPGNVSTMWGGGV